MGWLMSDGRVLASAEVLDGHHERVKGLLGRPGLEGAVVLSKCRWVHTMGMSFPIDVGYLDPSGTVLKTVTMPRWRIGMPVLRARTVIEAEGGSFARWGMKVGDQVEVTA
jgi:hypothetical protein